MGPTLPPFCHHTSPPPATLAAMGKRKDRASMEPLENPNHPPHFHPTTSTSERKRRQPRDAAPGAGSDSEPDPSPPSSPARSVRHLIEPYSKPRLASILVRCRGYGFLSFASRAAARRALRDAPRVPVAGRHVSAQFASASPDTPSGGGGGAAGKRVYVTNVAPDAGAERLRAFFARFGELEGGPFGFDADTGRSRGYAPFVYRAAAGAAAAVAEPYRVFEGRTLHCQLANEPARKAKTPPAPAAEAPALQPALDDAMAAAGVEDLAACARDPARAAALLGQNPALAAAVLSYAISSAGRPATIAAAVVPSPVKFGVGSSGGAGLLGPYKPPSSPLPSAAATARGGSSTAGSH